MKPELDRTSDGSDSDRTADHACLEGPVASALVKQVPLTFTPRSESGGANANQPVHIGPFINHCGGSVVNIDKN